MELTAASPQGLVVFRSKQPAWTAWTRKRSAFNAWTSLGDLSLAALPAYCSIDQHCTLSVHCRLIPAVVIITNSHHDQHDHFQSPQRKAALSWYVLVGETSAYVLTSPKIEASNWEGL